MTNEEAMPLKSEAAGARREDRAIDIHFLRSMSAALANEGKDYHSQRVNEIADSLSPAPSAPHSQASGGIVERLRGIRDWLGPNGDQVTIALCEEAAAALSRQAPQPQASEVVEALRTIRKIADNLEAMGVDATDGTIPALRKAADTLSRQAPQPADMPSEDENRVMGSGYSATKTGLEIAAAIAKAG